MVKQLCVAPLLRLVTLRSRVVGSAFGEYLLTVLERFERLEVAHGDDPARRLRLQEVQH